MRSPSLFLLSVASQFVAFSGLCLPPLVAQEARPVDAVQRRESEKGMVTEIFVDRRLVCCFLEPRADDGELIFAQSGRWEVVASADGRLRLQTTVPPQEGASPPPALTLLPVGTGLDEPHAVIGKSADEGWRNVADGPGGVAALRIALNLAEGADAVVPLDVTVHDWTTGRTVLVDLSQSVSDDPAAGMVRSRVSPAVSLSFMRDAAEPVPPEEAPQTLWKFTEGDLEQMHLAFLSALPAGAALRVEVDERPPEAGAAIEFRVRLRAGQSNVDHQVDGGAGLGTVLLRGSLQAVPSRLSLFTTGDSGTRQISRIRLSYNAPSPGTRWRFGDSVLGIRLEEPLGPIVISRPAAGQKLRVPIRLRVQGSVEEVKAAVLFRDLQGRLWRTGPNVIGLSQASGGRDAVVGYLDVPAQHNIPSGEPVQVVLRTSDRRDEILNLLQDRWPPSATEQAAAGNEFTSVSGKALSVRSLLLAAWNASPQADATDDQKALAMRIEQTQARAVMVTSPEAEKAAAEQKNLTQLVNDLVALSYVLIGKAGLSDDEVNAFKKPIEELRKRPLPFS